MKSRTETETREIRRVVMLEAAYMIEQEGRYKWSNCSVPSSCRDTGCVLGWIGYFAGQCGLNELETTSRWLGYSEGSLEFYQHMNSICLGWQYNPDLAAKNLRKLAEEI